MGPQGPPGPPGPGGIKGSYWVVGPAANPGFGLQFLAPPARVALAEAGQLIFVRSERAFGTTLARATSLNLAICIQPLGGPLAQYGTALNGMQATANTTTILGLTAVIRDQPAGTYDVGLCGNTIDPGSWNANGFGSTTAFVY